MNVSSTAKWVGLALIGILVAVGVAIAASNLASREIGLASQPIRAGDALAPPEASEGRSGKAPDTGSGRHRRRPPRATETPTPPTPEPPATTAPPVTTAPPGPPPGAPGESDSGGGDGDD
jgi:hypothetical protein